MRLCLLIVLIAYMVALLIASHLTSRNHRNEDFFLSSRKSPWYLVAFGMIGASISGVSFVSVPGWVSTTDMTYLQMCIGFIVGYAAVAFILLPVYYRMESPSIYSFLKERIGNRSYKTGAAFFFLSKITGAAARLYVACLLLHELVLSEFHIPFLATTAIVLAFIWFYTRRSGIRTLVWTDTLQTTCMLAALVLIIVSVISALDMNLGEAFSAIASNEHARIFEFDDWSSRQHFVKQFLSGIFIVIVMTGLDQDMMQKNLTCKTLRDAQKDMCCYGVMFVPVNLLLLALGVLLLIFCQTNGIQMTEHGDRLLPMLCSSGAFGYPASIFFTLAIMAAAFSSADSALTALTTSFCIDFINIEKRKKPEQTRRLVHGAMCASFLVFITLFEMVNNSNVIDAIYTIASYTYGPLLGMFAFGILFRTRTTNDRWMPFIAVASPIISFAINEASAQFIGYQFGYELLLLNGIMTMTGMLLLSKKETK